MANSDVRLVAVGDIMLGESPLCLGRGVSSAIRKRGPDHPFVHVVDCLKDGDLVFGNLEAVLSNSGAKRGYVRSLALRGDPKAAEGLKCAGFNVFSLANNHALEHGPEALEETMCALKEQGIGYVGVGASLKEGRTPLILSSKGAAVAFLAYCLVHDKTAYVSVDYPKGICDDVAKARTKADLVVVSLHWGSEYIHKPSPVQVRLAHDIIDSGCAVILGHHPHVLQGIERYSGGLIAYSLGNFVFDMWGRSTRESAILKVALSKSGVKDIEVVPVRINGSYQPEVLSGHEAKEVLSRLEDWGLPILHRVDEDMETHMAAYMEEAAACRRAQRREIRRYFVKNLLRYPPHYSAQIVMDYLARRTYGPR
jgi:poly-gamma-glutamate synthesis protein (capsule biosynthesis protein)